MTHLGSYLDQTLYDPYRKIVFMEDHDQLYKYAPEIKHRQLQDINDTVLVNTSKWSKANIQLHHAVGATEINRLEADLTFFRSLVVLFLLSRPLPYQVAWIELSLCLGLISLASRRHRALMVPECCRVMSNSLCPTQWYFKRAFSPITS
jgi:hypothetical protein